MKRRLAHFLLWVDYRMDGIRLRLFVAAAVVQVFLAPLWDQALPLERVAAGMEPMTFLATLNFLALTFALLGGRLLALSAPDEDEDSSTSPRLIRQMLGRAVSFSMRYLRLSRLEPWPAFISRIGAGLCVTLMALRGTAGLVRWTLWKAMRLVEDSLGTGELTTLRSGLTWVYRREQFLLQAVVLCSIPLSLMAGWAFLRRAKRGDRSTALRNLRELAGANVLVERSELASHTEVASAFRGDEVARLLAALAEWKPGKQVCDEQSCRDDLAFFLKERGHEVSVEHWLSQGRNRRRVDLLVAELIPIELKYALHEKGTGERDRARSQVESYAKIWGETGPVILLLAATPRPFAEPLRDFAMQWNDQLDTTRAPIIVVADTSNVASGRLLAAA